MLDMPMQVLEVIISNEGKPTEEIINSLLTAFPNKSFNTLKGYISSLHNSGYITVQYADNKIFFIGVNSSAYSALDTAKNQPQESNSQKTFSTLEIFKDKLLWGIPAALMN